MINFYPRKGQSWRQRVVADVPSRNLVFLSAIVEAFIFIAIQVSLIVGSANGEREMRQVSICTPYGREKSAQKKMD